MDSLREMSTDTKPSAGPAAPRKVGRPRRLTLEAVLDAALEVGLSRLTMAGVAERMGVASAVLYSYVSSREDLVRMAAAHASKRHDFPQDTGQHWALYVEAHAHALFELLAADSQMIVSFLSGGFGPRAEADRAEIWLGALTSRGFAFEEAWQLLRSIGHLVIGAAAAFTHARALRASGSSHELEARKTALSRDGELPLLSSHLRAFEDEEQLADWRAGLLLILRGVAADRGETLPISMTRSTSAPL